MFKTDAIDKDLGLATFLQQMQRGNSVCTGETTLDIATMDIAIFLQQAQARIDELEEALAVKTAQSEEFEAVTKSLLKSIQLLASQVF